MKAKRIAASALALTMSIATVASFTGCGDSSSSTAESKAAESKAADSSTADSTGDSSAAAADTSYNKVDGGGATLTIYTNRTDRVDDGSLAEMTKQFEQDCNCKVEYKGITEYSKDITTKLKSGDYGDVLMIPDEVEVKNLNQYFAPLGTYDELSGTYNWVDKKMDDTKTVYGIPYGGTATGILYNKKVWNDAGITTLPKTPEEFINDLKQIKEKTTGVVPYYTEYKDASWTITQWDSLVVSASGDPSYKVNLMKDKKDLFDKDGGYYKTYKFMYDLFSQKDLLEEDHSTTDWEKSKQWFADGKIASVVMGSWAISQFQKFAKNPDDIGYMPVPITAADGKQYAQTSADYCLGVSKNSKNIDLAKAYVEWFVKASGFAQKEGMISTVKGAELPSNLAEFKDAVLFSEDPTPDEYVGKFDAIDKDSKVLVSDGSSDNFKIKMAEAAFAGKGEDEFNNIIAAENEKWAKSRDSILK